MILLGLLATNSGSKSVILEPAYLTKVLTFLQAVGLVSSLAMQIMQSGLLFAEGLFTARLHPSVSPRDKM